MGYVVHQSVDIATHPIFSSPVSLSVNFYFTFIKNLKFFLNIRRESCMHLISSDTFLSFLAKRTKDIN